MATVNALFQIMDADQNGVVDKYEFLEYVRLNKPATGVYGTVAALVKAFGLDTKHEVTAGEFAVAFAKAGADLTPEMLGLKYTAVKPSGNALLGAASAGRDEAVRSMLDDKVDANHVRASDGASALFLASTNGQYQRICQHECACQCCLVAPKRFGKLMSSAYNSTLAATHPPTHGHPLTHTHVG